MVVPQFDAAEVDGRAGHVGAEGVVPVVEVHLEILQVPSADGEAARGDVPFHASGLIDLEPQGGILLDVQARSEVAEQFARVEELEVYLVRRSVPRCYGLLKQ